MKIIPGSIQRETHPGWQKITFKTPDVVESDKFFATHPNDEDIRITFEDVKETE